MNNNPPTSPQRALNLAAIVIAIVGTFGFVQLAIRISTNGFPYWSAAYLIRATIVPTIYLVCAWLIQRRAYGAWLTSGAVASSSLVTASETLLNIQWNPYLITPIWLATLFLPPIIALGGFLLAKRAFAHFPNSAAIRSARGRAVIVMRICGWITILLGLLPACALVVAMAVMASGHRVRNSEILGYSLLTILFAIGMTSGVVLLRKAPGVRDGQRPGGWTVAAAIASAVIMFLEADYVPLGISRLVGMGPNMMYSIMVQTFFKALFVWLVVEVFHTRRICDEPASYGFEPIFASPVVPPRNSNGPST